MSQCRRRDKRPKAAYASEDEALPHVGPGLAAYRCSRCGLWHVGHDDSYGRPARAARLSRMAKRKQRKVGDW